MTYKVGALPSDHFDGGSNMTAAQRTAAANKTLAEHLHLMQVHRVPSDIQTDAFTAAVNDTWEDYDIVAALNGKLAADIRTGEAVLLRGTLETINGETAVNTVKYGHGGTPDDDDKVRSYSTEALIQSEYIRGVELMTDASGQIKIEVNDRTNLTLKFHLESFEYVHATASA